MTGGLYAKHFHACSSLKNTNVTSSGTAKFIAIDVEFDDKKRRNSSKITPAARCKPDEINYTASSLNA